MREAKESGRLARSVRVPLWSWMIRMSPWTGMAPSVSSTTPGRASWTTGRMRAGPASGASQVTSASAVLASAAVASTAASLWATITVGAELLPQPARRRAATRRNFDMVVVLLREPAVDAVLLGEGGDVDPAVVHGRRVELGEGAERVARVALAVPQLVLADVGGVVGAQDAGDHRLVRVLVDGGGGPEDPGGGLVAVGAEREDASWHGVAARLGAGIERSAQGAHAPQLHVATVEGELLEVVLLGHHIDRLARAALPVDGGAVDVGAVDPGDRDRLHDLGVARGVELAEVAAVEDVELPLLAAAHGHVAAGDEDGAAGAEVAIAAFEGQVVVGREPVEDGQGVAVALELEEALAAVGAAHQIGAAVAGDEVNVAVVVDGGRLPRHPDAAVAPVGGRAPDHLLGQALGVVPEHPAVVGALVAVGGPGDVDQTLVQQQPRPLVSAQRIEGDHPVDAAGTGPRHGGLDLDGAAGALGTVAEVDGVQALEVGVVLLGAGDEVHRLARDVEGGRGHDPDVV